MAEERIEEAASAVVGGDAAGTAASGTPLTLEEKEALVSARAEEKRSAVRREALGWDRYNLFMPACCELPVGSWSLWCYCVRFD